MENKEFNEILKNQHLKNKSNGVLIMSEEQPECEGCIYAEDCKVLADQTQKGGNSECIIFYLKKTGE